jgi:outer membrane protein assembly factor BamB
MCIIAKIARYGAAAWVGVLMACSCHATAAEMAPAAKRVANAPAINWPQWRGPHGAGVADGQRLPVEWDRSRNIVWSAALPGWGTSSPVVFGERVFVTSQSMQKSATGDDAKTLWTLCFDRATGRELWRHEFGFGFDQHVHEKSNLAANTPAVTADAVYVSFGNAEFASYTHDGQLNWVRRLVPEFGDPKTAWGWGISPLLLPDAIVFPWDHHAGPCYLLGLDRATGEIAWRIDRPIGTGHATPLLVDHHGQTDILLPGKNRLTAFDAATRRQRWVYGEGEGPYNGEIIVSPVHADGVVYTQLWRQSPIHAIRLRGGDQPPERLWISEKPGPQEPSLLAYRGLLYALLDNGVLACLDGQTGAEHYRQRLGGDCNASPLASDGRIYLCNNDGQTFVVAAGRQFQLLATNNLDERITASPAVSGGRLILRTDSTLWCVGM